MNGAAMKRYTRSDDANGEERRKLVLDQENGEGRARRPTFGSVAGDGKLSRGEAIRLLGGGLAGAALLSTGLPGLGRAAEAYTPSPSNPGSLYVLDWESLAQRSVPGEAPPGWNKEYWPNIVHSDGKPQVKAYRQASLVPVRDG